MHPFRRAVEARDHASLTGLLAPDAVFTSPVAYRPYPGKPAAAAFLRAAIRVFEDFRYVREMSADDGAGGSDAALVFRATVGGKEVEGCDFLHTRADGLIDAVTVMVRPKSGMEALAAAMNAQFDRITAEAEAAAQPEAAAAERPHS
ncbi:nuclear transport factor 2 family protein [Nocardiopsis coralliicola]